MSQAELWVAHTAHCECGCGVLVRETDPMKGDTFKCPECQTINTVEGIYDGIRKDKSSKELEVIHIPFMD